MQTLVVNIDRWGNIDKTIPSLLSDLVYSSYAAQRDYGMTHEQCLSIGLGNDDLNKRYNQEKQLSNGQ